MAAAWVKQIASQVEKHGKRKASWYCYWKEPGGRLRKKSYGTGTDGRRLAEMRAAELDARLKSGTYEQSRQETWDTFLEQYRDGHLARLSPRSREGILTSLGHVERILHLKKKPLLCITAEAVERFTDARLKERGKKKGSTVAVASVNKDLRDLRTRQ